MILVTGATGNVGSEVARALVARKQAVRALVRDPSRSVVPTGPEVVAGDLGIPGSLDGALAGVERCFSWPASTRSRPRWTGCNGPASNTS